MFARSLTLGVAAAALLVSGAQAADLIIPTTPEPIFASAPGFDWDGLYAGVHGGGFFGNDLTQGFIGGVVGANFTVSSPFLIGAEMQLDYAFENEDDNLDDRGEVLALVRLGAVVTDSVLVYAAGGVGTTFNDNSDGFYALGGGVEFAVADNISIRGEILGEGSFDDDFNDDFFDDAKASVGVLFHF